MVHDNAQCQHGQRDDIAAVRKHFMEGVSNAAIRAMGEVKRSELDKVEQVAFDAMLLVTRARLHPAGYVDIGDNMDELVARAQATQDPNIWAEVLGMQIMLSHQYGNPYVTQQLITDFFFSLPRTPVTIGHWAAVCGRVTFAAAGPEVALHVFKLGLSGVVAQQKPCLHESLWRYIAAMLARQNDLAGALAALARGGVPQDRRDKYSLAPDGTVMSNEIAQYRL